MKYQNIIIGGGPAGYTAAELLGRAGQSVVLFDKKGLGGVCLNEGCIPTKTLLYSAKMYNQVRSASKYGVNIDEASFDLGKIISRKTKVVRKLGLGIKARLSDCGVVIVEGEAFIHNKNEVTCNGERYECEHMIVCTGSSTFIPPIPGLEDVDYWTHRDALNSKELPQSVTIIGGGVIGMEFASFYNSLGVDVTIVEMLPEILAGMDMELSAALRSIYQKKGVKFHLSSKVTRVMNEGEELVTEYSNGEENNRVISQKILVSVGRKAATEGYGLENLHLGVDDKGKLIVDEYMQSTQEGVYICGDMTGVSLLAHTAVREAEVAVHHITGTDDNMSYKSVPSVVYTNPEVASVGLSEEVLKAAGFSYRTINLPMAYSGRFVAENEGINGICKVLIADDDTILGVHMLGNPASELIVTAVMMIQDERKYTELKHYIFPHPTVGEIYHEL